MTQSLANTSPAMSSNLTCSELSKISASILIINIGNNNDDDGSSSSSSRSSGSGGSDGSDDSGGSSGSSSNDNVSDCSNDNGTVLLFLYQI